jgi:murein DD-endopeptidase MepM/ murein hydrolase activator NlpD
MRHFSMYAVVLLSTLYMPEARAQFHTIQSVGLDSDTLFISTDPYVRDVASGKKEKKSPEKKSLLQLFGLGFTGAKIGKEPPKAKRTLNFPQEKGEKSSKEKSAPLFSMPQKHLLSPSDSLILYVIKNRLTFCMPLDLVNINSAYGYRRDPFTKCRKFHDGIDLQGGHDLVYSMLPGTVVKAEHGDTGYGNYVILDHGTMRCLYGHLSEVYAKQGMAVQAGSIVGRVGSSGRSTGRHLHIRLQRLDVNGTWQSTDPLPLLRALREKVMECDRQLAQLTGQEEQEPQRDELTLTNLYAALKRHGIKYPKIVLAQAILETGNFRSRLCREDNNLFGLRHSKGYYTFDHWEASVIAYRDWVQYKHRDGEGYYAFLQRIGYASAKDYIYKVRQIADGLDAF